MTTTENVTQVKLNVMTEAQYSSATKNTNELYMVTDAKLPASDISGLATVATSGAYSDLTGTPTIPTVNNATLTITQGGTTKGTFTANASSDVTIDLDSGGGSVYVDNKSITTNSSDEIQTVGVIDSNNTTNAIKTWTGTKAQYEALLPTSTTYYAWDYTNIGSYNYTTSPSPSVGDHLWYYEDGEMREGTESPDIITQVSGNQIYVMDELDYPYYRSPSNDVTITSGGSIDANTLYNITDDTDVSLTILEALYPVGSVYITTANTCPLSTLISGSTWELVSSGRVLQGADSGHSAGTTIEAGLPDINGGSSGWMLTTAQGASGCFSGNRFTQSNPPYASPPNWNITSGGGEWYRDINFRAGLSNSIYGNSTTVQPPAYIVNIYRRTA